MGIGFSLVVVVIAALNLVLDFDFIEQGVKQQAPKYMEWYGGFSLLVTLVWMYLGNPAAAWPSCRVGGSETSLMSRSHTKCMKPSHAEAIRLRSQMKSVLFLCTGNYYRSRFAEILFNWAATTQRLPWRADSRGLQLHPENPGPISPHVVQFLEQQGIRLAEPIRFPRQVSESDLQAADLVVAVKEAEHRPLLARRLRCLGRPRGVLEHSRRRGLVAERSVAGPCQQSR